MTVVDLLKRGNPLDLNVIKDDYANLDADFLHQFDAVLWFGGHSSVTMSVDDPDGAVANNCLNLFAFAKRLSRGTKFVYASSGSLCSTGSTDISPASEDLLGNIPVHNAYDISKFAFDYLANNFLSNFFSLRMGTLSGYSPNLRPELVFNAMNLSAVNSRKVYLRNSDSFRTILFLSDLWAMVRKLLLTMQQPGIYNVGSHSCRIGELASLIANTWNAEIIKLADSDTYSFMLDTSRMKAICGNDLAVENIPHICRDFIGQYTSARTSR